jgi:protein tyrosine phosphatase (PTP) superfamily phosphohydrolase (DUF442 family)
MASSPTQLAESSAPSAAPARRRPWKRWFLRALMLGVVGVAGWQGFRVFVGDNVHVLIPGEIYRGGQPSASSLASLVKRYKIRTVVNLRGTCYPQNWYMAEARAAQDAAVDLEDVCFSAGRLPSHHEIRQLVDVLDHAERPLFLHCRHGADRTGMASVIALLLLTDAPYAEARRQLSLRYAHAPVGRSTILDRFFDLYEEWLTSEGRTHDRAALRHWLLDVYRGGECQSVIEGVTPLQKEMRVGDPLAWRVRVRNASAESWHFKPTRTAGVHLGYYLWDQEGKSAGTGRAGMLDKIVPPGEELTVTLVIPPLQRAGRYRLLIDMIEEGHCWFFQTGSEPYEEELDVRN